MPGRDRKDVLTDQRTHEINASKLLQKIANERLYRRAREFSLRAVFAAKHGESLEKKELEKQDLIDAENLRKLNEKNMKDTMIAKSLQYDRKWIKNDKIGQMHVIDVKNTVSKLMHMPKYNHENQAPSRVFDILTLEDSKKVRGSFLRISATLTYFTKHTF